MPCCPWGKMSLWELKVHGGVRVCKVMIEDIFGVKARVGNLMIRQDLQQRRRLDIPPKLEADASDETGQCVHFRAVDSSQIRCCYLKCKEYNVLRTLRGSRSCWNTISCSQQQERAFSNRDPCLRMIDPDCASPAFQCPLSSSRRNR